MGCFPSGVREADAPLDYTAVVARGSQLAESAERNMLGQLKGDAALWQKVVAVYEKGGAPSHPLAACCSKYSRSLAIARKRFRRSGAEQFCR